MEWIDVKDKLPDKDGKYLVCTKSFLGRFIRIISYTLNYESPFDEYLQGRAIWYNYDGEAGDYEVLYNDLDLMANACELFSAKWQRTFEKWLADNAIVK